MTTLAVKRVASAGPGEFQARVYLVGGPPDGDGDVLPPVPDGHGVQVSLRHHNSALGGAAPAGEAELYHVGNAVHAFGRVYDSAPGRALRAKLLETGPQQEWSIAWPTATAKTRLPTADELVKWPDARRIIEQWNPIEISPVDRGACGPMCRTISAKGSCGCGGKCRTPKATPPRPADLVEALPSVAAERAVNRVVTAAKARWGIRSPFSLKWFRRPIARCCGQLLDDRTPPEVWIATAQDLLETGRSAAHELYHLHELEMARAAGRPPWFDEPRAEGEGRYLVDCLIEEGAEAFQGVRGKYAMADAPWRPSSNTGEAAFNRWRAMAGALHRLLTALVGTDSWQDSRAPWDRLVEVYSNQLGREAGGTLAPEYSREVCIASGLADLWSRFNEVVALETQLGGQLAVFRRAFEAPPSSQQLARLMPPRPVQPVRGET